MPRALLHPPVDPVALLRSSEMFADLPAPLLEEAAQGMQWCHLLGGEVLFHQGDAGDALYLVVSGRLRVLADDGEGHEQSLREIGRGGKVGELSLLTDEPRSATVRALRDTTLARFSRDLFQHLVSRHPGAVLPLTRALASLMRRNHLADAASAASTIALVPLHRGIDLRPFAEDLCRVLSRNGATLRIDVELVQSHVPGGAAHGDDAHPAHSRLSGWLDELELTHRHLVYEGDVESVAWTKRCIREADRVLFIAASGGDRAESAATIARLTRDRPPGAAEELVLIHGEGASPAATAAWLALHRFAGHIHVHREDDRDLERLSRHLTGAAVGVVLSGGAARGFAHIGVLRALDEAGIPVDRIGGTSMGSVIAAQYAARISPAEMLEVNRLWAVHNPLRDLTLPVIALISGTSGLALLEAMFGDLCIEDLWLPYFCVSANLTRSEIAVHRQGPLSQWVRSSVAIPGIVPPLRLANGDLLVDGGVLNNMPADVMLRLGAGTTIAVDVAPPEPLPTEDYLDQPTVWQMLRQLRSTLLPFGTALRAPTIFTILYRTMLVGSRSLSERLKNDVDLYIAPPVGRFGLFDWHAIESAAEVGYREARKALQHWTAAPERSAARKRSGSAPVAIARTRPRPKRTASRSRARLATQEERP